VWTLSVGLVNENVSDGRVKDPVKLKLGREIEAGSRLSGTGAAFKRLETSVSTVDSLTSYSLTLPTTDP